MLAMGLAPETRRQQLKSALNHSPVNSQLSGADALLLLETIQECVVTDNECGIKENIFPRIQRLFDFDFGGSVLCRHGCGD